MNTKVFYGGHVRIRSEAGCILKIKNPLEFFQRVFIFMAGPTRLELATSGVTGRRSNQTELRPRVLVGGTGLEPVTLGL
jgi:hypothetical protein